MDNGRLIQRLSILSGLREGLDRSLQLNDFLDRFWDGRRCQLFLDGWVIGSVKLSDLVGDPDDKGKCTL